MQVGSLNTPAASAASATQAPAEESDSRAAQFARALKNAFFGAGSVSKAAAVSRSAERSAPAAAQAQAARSQDNRPPAPRRHEVRSEPSRPAGDSGESRRLEYRDSRSETGRTQIASQKPADKTAAPPRDVAARPAAEKPAAPAEKPTADTAAVAAPANPVEKAADPSLPQPVVAEQLQPVWPTEPPAEPVAAAPAAEVAPPADAPAAQTAPAAAVILALLQGDAAAAPEADPAAAAQALAAAAQTAEGKLPAAQAAAQPVIPAGAQPVLPADAAAPAAAALPVDADANAAMPPAQHPAGHGKPAATETSAAALLSQQQETVGAEDFAAIQQALAAQTAPSGKAAGRPVAEAAAKPGKAVQLDIQSAAAPAAASKTLVDQSALLAMQGEEAVAADADGELAWPMPQAALPAQPPPADARFAAALQSLTGGNAMTPQGHVSAAGSQGGQHSPAHLMPSAAPLSNPGTPAPQAAQQAHVQFAGRQLGAFVPAGEQVAVQIKRGAAEGLDKISIKLDPGNLGKVEVKMEVGHDGRLTAVIAADKPDTLAMLQRDAASLEQALRDAGLKTASDSLNFTLRDQSQAGEGRDGRGNDGRQRGLAGDEVAEGGAHIDTPAQLAAANAQRAAAARGGLDIRI